MRTLRRPRRLTPAVSLLVSLLAPLAAPPRLGAQQPPTPPTPAAATAHAPDASRQESRAEGIKEVVPEKLRARYEQWKAELLSTETGRAQWERYAGDAGFSLTVAVTCKEGSGAGTSKYRWDDAGRLVAATITLGCRIDEGYPNAVYYPVMYSLSTSDSPFIGRGAVLAAAKFAHEFGHVGHARQVDGALYRLQNKLMPDYNKILLANGRNVSDPRLVEMAGQMCGTPVEIWEDREYWGEANAMLYLRDRITKQSEQRALFARIMRTVELYAGNYSERFGQIAQE